MKKAFQVLVVVLLIGAALVAAYFILRYEPGAQPAGETTERAEAPTGGTPGSVQLVSWNIANLGGSKDDAEIGVMAKVLRDFDLVAIQEVITSPPGAQAVARLVDQLDRSGADWDYVISDPTSGRGSERYAYLWKPSRVRLVGRPWLEQSIEAPIDREPFMGRFEARGSGRQLLVASFHAVPKGKNPANEILLLDELHRRYTDDDLVIVGDFNLPQDEEAFDELKALGYAPALVGQRTSIRMFRGEDGRHLANEYDNIFYERAPLRPARVGVVDFTEQFPVLKDARYVSDHLPVYAEMHWN